MTPFQRRILRAETMALGGARLDREGRTARAALPRPAVLLRLVVLLGRWCSSAGGRRFYCGRWCFGRRQRWPRRRCRLG